MIVTVLAELGRILPPEKWRDRVVLRVFRAGPSALRVKPWVFLTRRGKPLDNYLFGMAGGTFVFSLSLFGTSPRWLALDSRHFSFSW